MPWRITAIHELPLKWISGSPSIRKMRKKSSPPSKRLASISQELSPALFLKKGQIIRMGVPPLRIEVATSISGVRFEECYAARVIDILDEVEVNLISLTHLKANKKAVGRYKDLNDLENLP